MSSSVKIKGLYVSTEAFRHDTVLFLTGGPVPPGRNSYTGKESVISVSDRPPAQYKQTNTYDLVVG